MPNPLRKKNAFISPFLIHKTSKLISLNVLCNSETINNYHELFWLAVKRFMRACDRSWYREPEVAHLVFVLLTAKKVTGTLSCTYNALQKYSFTLRRFVKLYFVAVLYWLTFEHLFPTSAIKNVFRVCIAWYKHERSWQNSRQLCKPETNLRVCITVENSPYASSVYIRLCKHRKEFSIAFIK